VILVDANPLVYAHVGGFAQHAAARAWLDERPNGSARVRLPWSSLLAFVRLVTNPRVFERPEPVASAWQQVSARLQCEAAWIPTPGERYRDVLEDLLKVPGMQANLVPHAHPCRGRDSSMAAPTPISRAFPISCGRTPSRDREGP
jgi:predicted nucleic acid-binding protein